MIETSFNLLDEPWIPVEDLGGKLKEVSLKQLFSEAAELRRVIDASPPVTAALYRLLFAIISRSLLLSDLEDWQDAWDETDFGQQVLSYLEAHRHRFDLFSPEAPFSQVRNMPENCRLFPWTKLALELPPNSAKLLFDHTDVQTPPACTPAEAARSLLGSIAFTVGAGRSCTGYTMNAPLTAAMVVIPEGPNLQDTLLANALPAEETDLPLWEQPPLTAAALDELKDSAWQGHIERLTWPARGIELIPEDVQGNVRWIKFGMGWKTPDIEGDRDPWVMYQTNSKGSRFPVKLNPARMIWRDFHSMLAGAADGTRESVETLTRLAWLADAERQPPASWTVLIAAIAADRANIKAWSQERWSVPRTLIGEDVSLSALNDALLKAEQYGESVRKIIWVMVHDLLSGTGEADRAQTTAISGRMPVLNTFWSNAGGRFQALLELLDIDVDEAEKFWTEVIAESLTVARAAAFSLIGRDARALRAWAKAAAQFDWLIRKARRALSAQPSESEEARHGTSRTQ